MSEERFDRIDETLKGINQRLDSMGRRFDGVDQQLGAVDRRFDGVDHRIDEVDRHMHLLHEEAMGRIADIPGYAGATKGDVAELRGEMHQRVEPLEAAVRHHSVEIERLKKGRG